jgi:hypothetical protein
MWMWDKSVGGLASAGEEIWGLISDRRKACTAARLPL